MNAADHAVVARLWSLGDYEHVAAQLRPAGVGLVDHLGDGHGRRALDLATGTGTVAVALAQRGWAVSAIDLCEPLLDTARRTAAAQDLVVNWRLAPLDAVPFEDAAFSLVTSSFGLIFGTDPAGALREAWRCLTPGGLLAFTAWRRSGYVAEMSAVMGRFLPAGPESADPLAWGDLDTLTRRLRDGFTNLNVQPRGLSWSFDSAEAGADAFFARSPVHVAAAEAAGDSADALRAAVREHLATFAAADGRVDVESDYVLVTARRS